MKKMIGKLALLTALIMLLQSCGSVQPHAKDTDAQTTVVSTTASVPAEVPAAADAPTEEVVAEEEPSEAAQAEEAAAEEASAEATITEEPAAEETPAEATKTQEAAAEEPAAEEEPSEAAQPEEAAAEEASAEETVTEEPAAEETPAEATETEEAAAEEPAAEEVASEVVQTKEAAAEEASAEETVAEEPASEETPAEATETEEAAAEEPAAEEEPSEAAQPEEDAAEEVPAEETVTEEPAAEETPAEATETEEAAAEEPAAEEEASEAAQPEEAAAEEASAEATVAEEPASEETPAEATETEEAAAEEPAAEEAPSEAAQPEEAAAEEASAEETVTEEPASEETPAEATETEEAAAEEPAAEEAPSEAAQPEEAAAEEASAEETITEEPAAEETPAEATETEEAAAEEPAAEEEPSEAAQPEEGSAEEVEQVPASIPFELKVSKQLSGREYREGDSWTFFLSAPEGTPMPEKTEVTVTPTEGDTVVLSFGTVSFTEADLEKTFSYTISEKNEQPGVSSELPMVLLVRLEKNEDDGSLNLITSGGEDGPVFRDVYASDGQVRLAGTMRITGRAFLPEDHWTVTLQADEGTPLPEIQELTFECLSGETVDFDFGTVRFTEADAGKTYRYHFLSDGEGVGVINAEDTVFDLIVTDQADGTLQILSSTPELEIVQRFAADSPLEVNGTLTLSGRDFQPGDEIALTLFGDENAPMPEQTQLILKPDAGNETAFDFGEIIFTEANIGQHFTYTIVESSETPGLVLDADHLFQVRVDMVPDCSLQVRSSLDGRDLHIATGYEASSALNIGGTGLAQGWKPSERYPILVSISADEGTPMPAETAVAPNAYTDEGYTFVFPEIVYDLADAGREYVYTLTESCAAPGIEASDPVTVRVSVADGGDGTLQLSTAPEQVVMNSAYYAQGFLNVTLNHVFEGRSITAGDAWTFRLSADKGTPLPEETEFTVSNAADTIILFDPIWFKEVAGADLNYVYTLTVTCEMPGVAVPEPLQINVHVYDRGHGKLGIEAKPVLLKSMYRANGAFPLRGVKTLTGRDFQPGDSWTLQVKGEENAPMPEWSEITLSPLFGNGIQFDFGSILYSEKDIGKTYVYTLSEASEIGGVTDTEPMEIKVQVSDQLDGTLKIESMLPESGIMLESTYESCGSLTLNGKKTISGRSFMEGEAWQYVISGSADAPLPEETTIKLLPTDGQEMDILFGTIDYTLKDAGNTYTYTITESTDCTGVTVSEPITFQVKITDQLDGTLKAEASLEEDSLVFASVYSASATIDLAGMMAIVNRDYHPGDAWTVTLASREESAPQPELWAVELAPEEGREVPFSFGSVTFTEANAGQLYLYTVGLRGEAAMVTNAPDQTLEIHVLDNGDGTLTIEGAEGAGSLRFENMYHASGEADLAFSVVLKNRDWLPEDSSAFTLEAAEGTPLPENLTDITLCPTKDEITSATFGVAHFTEADIGKSYEYVIHQQAEAAGVTAEAEKRLTLTVTDNGDGTLTVQPPEGETAPVFENTYDASASMTLPVRVLIQGRHFLRSDVWNVQIDAEDEGAPMPEENELQVKWAADDLLEINLGTLRFGLDDVGKTWHYQVKFNGEMPGITNDEPKQFTVSVTDPFTGELALEVEPGTDPVAEFHVVYEASGSIDFQGTLSLTGRTATPQDAWDLVLTPDQEGAPMPEQSRLTVKPFVDESFTFGPIIFTEADAGKTYSYTLSVDGKTVSTINAAPETLTVLVEDRGDGTLGVQGGKPVQLVNTYEVSGSYRLRGAMSITGREFLPGDSWTFTVTAEDGTPMPERQTLTVEPTEGKSCVLDFGQIIFDTEDCDQEYVYLISVTACPEGIQVPAARLIHVTPRDNKEGKFYFSRSGDTILFENIYTAAGDFSVNAQVCLTGRESTAKDLFTLLLTAEEGAPLPEKTEISAVMTAGHPVLSVPFGFIHFTEADAGKTYTYTMQLLTDLPGVSLCEPQSFTLSAADLYNGRMSVSLTEAAQLPAFTCVYSAEGDYVLSGSVRMNGRSFREKEPWQIQVTALEEGAPLPEVTTITMEAEGGKTDAPFAFTIHFTEADAGKIYTYEISVSGGAEDLTLDSKKEVRVLVEDAGNGSLTFRTDYPAVEEETLVLESGLRKDFSLEYDDQQKL